MERIKKLRKHLEIQHTRSVLRDSGEHLESDLTKSAVNFSFSNLFTEDSRKELVKKIPNKIDGDLNAEVKKLDDIGNAGKTYLYMEELAKEFSSHSGGKGYSNVGIPNFFMARGELPKLDFLVCLGNYEDAKRIAESHTKKSLLYGTTFLANGVLGTNDNEMWQHQRKELSDAFLPNIILSRIFKISLNRAEKAVNEILPSLILKQRTENEGVEINEFLLYEAMAQLQLALLGEDEEKMDSWNSHIRRNFNTSMVPRNKDENGEYIRTGNIMNEYRERVSALKEVTRFSNEILERGEQKVKEGTAGPVMENLVGMCPFHSEKLTKKMKNQSASTFLFAGHDTTANLMTHFIYEMARNPNWCTRVQEEIDFIFDRAAKEERQISYEDLKDLQVMKRCINETLRLWPSVPNGTLREIEREDWVQGYNNEKVTLIPGVQVIIPVWLLHRNPHLWGDDAHLFNPSREWLPEEDWNGQGLSGVNPQSHRFCPFTFRPRDCMGRNFAQMEARVILGCILRKYNVSLGEATAGKNLTDILGNFGTLGAKNGLYIKLHERRSTLY